MHISITITFDQGKGEGTFGARDEDWQLYKLMSRDNDDQDEDETELTCVSSRREVSQSSYLILTS